VAARKCASVGQPSANPPLTTTYRRRDDRAAGPDRLSTSPPTGVPARTTRLVANPQQADAFAQLGPIFAAGRASVGTSAMSLDATITAALACVGADQQDPVGPADLSLQRLLYL
jgi:hypothetical protein